MDRRLNEAILGGDKAAFLSLINEDEDHSIIDKRSHGSNNTVLHLASRFGHLELVHEIIRIRPGMVSSQNQKLETPLHEACREGHYEITMALLSAEPSLGYKLNRKNQSVLFVACSAGQRSATGIVSHLLLNYPSLLISEEEGSTTSLHSAASAGHTEVVKEILKVRPEFASTRDSQGCSPLHLACSRGHVDITKELLKLDSDLCLLQDNDGKTPLHWAAIKGRINILNEILSVNLDSIENVTNFGETILHLCVKYNQYEVTKYLVETSNISKLINATNNDGNTVLHIAASAQLLTMATFLLERTGVDVNVVNGMGLTALDVVESHPSCSENPILMQSLIRDANGRNGRDLMIPPQSPRIQTGITASSSSSSSSNIIVPAQRSSHERGRPRKSQPPSRDNVNPMTQNTPPRMQHHHQGRPARSNNKFYNKALESRRDTITLVAVLIATVTFTAGINPPGGFHQEGALIGKAVMGRTTAFKVFNLCNNVALLLSLGVVVMLMSLVPLGWPALRSLSFVAYWVLFAAMLLMEVAYVSAAWVTTPATHSKGTRWELVTLSSFGGVLLFLFAVLALSWRLIRSTYQKRRQSRT